MVFMVIIIGLLVIGAVCAFEGTHSVRHIADPCRCRHIGWGRFFTDPNSGHLSVALVDTNEISGMEIILIDLIDDSAESFTCTEGNGAWSMLVVSGNRLVIGTYYKAQFIVFDLRERKFITHVGLPDEMYIWRATIGSDGRIYGGTTPGAKLVALDLDTCEVEDCGAPAPPNTYLRFISSLPDGRVYCEFCWDVMTQLIYDPDTGEFTKVPPQLEGVLKGVSWGGCFFSEDRAFSGTDLTELEKRPIPGDDSENPFVVEVDASNRETLILMRGSEVHTLNVGDTATTLLNTTDLRGARIYDVRDGKVLGVRGVDYFILEKDKPLQIKRIPLTPNPRPAMFLRASPAGELWGGPAIGQNLFRLNPETGEFSNTATISDNVGEAYDVSFVGSDVYVVSYKGGEVIRYRPDDPWDQMGNVNPRALISLREKGYIRPIAGLFHGPDDVLYSGFAAEYGTYSGALAIIDTKTEEISLIKDPLGVLAVSGVAADEQFIYLSTTQVAISLQMKVDTPPAFAVMDKDRKQILYQKEFPGSICVSVLGLFSKLGKVVVGIDADMALFDITKQDFEDTLPADLPNRTSGGWAMAGNALVYGSQNDIIRLDLVSMEWQKLAEAPREVGCVSATSDKIYISCKESVYEVTPILK